MPQLEMFGDNVPLVSSTFGLQALLGIPGVAGTLTNSPGPPPQPSNMVKRSLATHLPAVCY